MPSSRQKTSHPTKLRHPRPNHSWTGWLLFLGVMQGIVGCAAFSNPLSDGVPVNRVPPQFLAKPKEEQVSVPLNLLQKKQETEIRIYPGAILGVFIEGILGEPKQPPPVQLGDGRLPPSIGYPVVVRDDGTISLPLLDPIKVEGMSASEAEKEIIKTLTDKGFMAEKTRVIITLQRENQNHILVLRQDAGGVTFSGGLSNTKRGTGFPLDLPNSESDVATALTRTGGLPGLDANNEVIVLRRNRKDGKFPEIMPDMRAIAKDRSGQMAQNFGFQVARIPLRLKPGEPLPFTQDDVTLNAGDIVFIDSRDTEVYYVGGIIPPNEIILPRDYDLDVVEAVAQARGALFNGALGGNNFTGQFIAAGIGQPSPSQLSVVRRIPTVGEIRIRVDLNKAARDPRERLIVMPGDILILQETLGEAFARYMTSAISFSGFSTILRTPTSAITGSSRFP